MILGRGVEGSSSVFGVGPSIVWMLLVALFLWRAAIGAERSEAKQEQ